MKTVRSALRGLREKSFEAGADFDTSNTTMAHTYLALAVTISVLARATSSSSSDLPRDALLDEAWSFFYGPGNASTFFLEAFDSSSWPLVTVPHDWSATPLPPRAEDQTNAPVLEIRNGTWLFNRGDPPDNVTWAFSNYSDASWQSVQVPGDWREPPISYEEYDSFGWFRRHFTVADWQLAAAEAGSLRVALGTVAAASVAWINGVQVGGSIPADPNSLNCFNYGQYQQYRVPAGLLVGGGGDNVIAVRVLAQGGPLNASAALPGAVSYAYLGEGFLADGDDVATGEMTLAEAEAQCASLPTCCAITFASSDAAPAGAVKAYLKSKVNFSPASGWQSYTSSRPCVRPSLPGGLYDVAWGDQRVGALDPGASLGGRPTGYSVGGVSWYRRSFATPAGVAAGAARSFLRFDGVYQLADVWLNGQHLGQHPYGYTTFQFDVTALLNPAAPNVVAVRVDNGGQNSRWYSGSGVSLQPRTTRYPSARL